MRPIDAILKDLARKIGLDFAVDYINRHQWTTWVGHGLAGFIAGFLASWYGAGIACGFYAHKEYRDSTHFSNIVLDNVMDFICPVVGGIAGALVRPLVL